MKTSDFLVIGAGVAGLSFALRAAEHGKVAVITKGKFLDCSSAKAQGGIAAVWDRNDSFEDHVADTLDAGAGLCNEQAVRTIVEEGPDAIRELLEWGVNFDPGNQGEDYELAREGGHTKRRILHAKDATGLEITSKLLEAAKLHPNIELLEDHAHLGAQGVHVHFRGVDARPFKEDVPLLDRLQTVQATDERALAGPGRPADDQHLAFLDPLGNTFEHMELAVPFMDIPDFDQRHRFILSR